MNINEVYEKLCHEGITKSGEQVKVSSGLFKEDDLLLVSPGATELYFKVDKQGLFEILDIILPQISNLSHDNGYSYMINLFTIVNNEIDNYFGHHNQAEREKHYLLNGVALEEDVRVCSMSQIKGAGIAMCAEKASLSNNIFLILHELGLFEYKVNYLNCILALEGDAPGGHAFLEFDRVTPNGTKHLIYDVTIPEKILIDGDYHNYAAIYSLNDEEYESFLEGGSFDNKFILADKYQLKEKREYKGFSKEEDKKLQ